jgi:hypothetical protein
MSDRLDSFVKLKKAAYALASERGFFKKGILLYDMSLNLKERSITEHIIKSTWAYHKNNSISISNTEENNLIFTNCIYAGMYASKYLNEDAESILYIFDWHGITSIEEFVERNLDFSTQEYFVTAVVAKGLALNIRNNFTHLYAFSTTEDHWNYYKDVACVMFELGAMFYNNRD